MHSGGAAMSGSFFRGLLVALLWQNMNQDLMGKEKYLKFADMFWMDTQWWWYAIPAVILCLVEARARSKEASQW